MNLKHAVKLGTGALLHKLTGKKFPLNIMLALTNRCNSFCNYCRIPQRKIYEMNTKEILSLIDQAAGLGCARIGLWGGEPLLREDIGKIIDHAVKKGLYVTMDTNGFLIPDRIDEISGLHHLVVSLDGREETNDMNRSPGSYRKAMRAIETALSRNIPVWTITVLTRNNLGDIDYLAETAKKMGFSASFQLLHHNDYLGRNHPELIPDNESYRQAIRRLYSLKKSGAPIVNSYNYLRYLYSWPDYSVSTRQERHRGLKCLAGQLYCNIDTNGDIYPCSLLVDCVKAPNTLELGLKKAFEKMAPIPCESCIATCFIEYNYIFSLNVPTILSWMMNMSKLGKTLRFGFKPHNRRYN